MTTLSDFLQAAEKGAASIYHDALAAGVSLVKIEATNPAVEALLAEGVGYANALLMRSGIPAGVANVIEADVWTALKGLAAVDATVTSGGPIATTTTTTTKIAGIVAPAGLLDAIENAGVTAAESVIASAL